MSQLGQIINVPVHPSRNAGADEAPAIVTRVNDDGTVNLRVLLDVVPVNDVQVVNYTVPETTSTDDTSSSAPTPPTTDATPTTADALTAPAQTEMPAAPSADADQAAATVDSSGVLAAPAQQ